MYCYWDFRNFARDYCVRCNFYPLLNLSQIGWRNKILRPPDPLYQFSQTRISVGLSRRGSNRDGKRSIFQEFAVSGEWWWVGMEEQSLPSYYYQSLVDSVSIHRKRFNGLIKLEVLGLILRSYLQQRDVLIVYQLLVYRTRIPMTYLLYSPPPSISGSVKRPTHR